MPRLVVLHYTDMGSAEAALDRLCDPVAGVSAHYLIGRDGQGYQLVAEADRAWHAGAGAWQGCEDVNSASIGIELDNDGAAPFAARQMAALEDLLDAIMARYAIPADGIIAHADMAPERKADPGPRFDWRRLALGGRAIWPDPGQSAHADWLTFRAAITAIGYPDAADGACLSAFRARFRPWATGPLSSADCAAAADLATRFGIDRRPRPA